MVSKVNDREKAAAIERALIRYYHQGHARSDFRLYNEILHPDWKYFLLLGEDLKIVIREEFNSWYLPENFNPDLDWETEIYSIDITGNLAAVKLRIENQQVMYIDYLHLMYLEDRWWIVHKLSQENPKPKSAT